MVQEQAAVAAVHLSAAEQIIREAAAEKIMLPEAAEPEAVAEVQGGTFPKVQLLSDCRCIVCKKIGFNIQKQLEKLALIKITKLDIEIVSDRI